MDLIVKFAGFMIVRSSPMNIYTLADMSSAKMMKIITGLKEGDILSIRKLGQFQVTGFDVRTKVEGIYDLRQIYIDVEEVNFDNTDILKNRLQEFINKSKKKGETLEDIYVYMQNLKDKSVDNFKLG